MKQQNQPSLSGALGRWACISLTVIALSACNDNNSQVSAPTNPQSTLPFEDFNDISGYAKKAVSRLEAEGLLSGLSRFNPQQAADRTFAQQLLGVDIPGSGDLDVSLAKQLITQSLIDAQPNETVSFEGFLSKKGLLDTDSITREDFAYMVTQAKQINIIKTGTTIHNPAISTPGPLLGPTVFESGTDSNGPLFDGSTISLFHRAKNAANTSFDEQPVFTLQVHPEVFKSVSVGGIGVDVLQDLSAQLEVELVDGSIHRTPLSSMIPFSIHGADGKRDFIRVEDGILVLVEDLLGYVDNFDLNGNSFTKEETIHRMLSQHYYNGDKTDAQVLETVVQEISEKGFSLQDRRLMLHNMILTKTALQQAGLSALSAPFNTIAGGSSKSRGFEEGHLFATYQLALDMREKLESGETDSVRAQLNATDAQQNLLDGTKILTAATLLPHISSLANAPFLPNEALSSRVKKSGALLASEPIAFQFDRLKRAAYILLDEALSQGNTSHKVTHGEIIQSSNSSALAFTLRAGNFEAAPLKINQSVLLDALYDYTQAYENLIHLISGVPVMGSLTALDANSFTAINDAFSNPIMNEQMAHIKIGDLVFEMDMLATPSHVKDSFAPANELTSSRRTEAFGLSNALQPFPQRLVSYICEGKVVTETGDVIADAKIKTEQQLDLIQDISIAQGQDCVSAVSSSPRYKQLLFVDNFQLPPFGPSASFISTQGIEIINRILLTPVDTSLAIKDIRLSYRLNETDSAAKPFKTSTAVNQTQ